MVTIKPNHADRASNVWKPDDTGDRDFVMVHSAKKRLVSFRMERDFWLHLVRDKGFAGYETASAHHIPLVYRRP
jgi:hypothetical protein